MNFIVGDFDYNYQKIVNGYCQAVSQGADLVVGTELALFGYPPADLLFRRQLLDFQQHYFDRLCGRIGTVGLIIGVATPTIRAKEMPLYNSGVLLRNGKVVYQQNKSLLPNYDVFNEKRYFEPSPKTLSPFEYDGCRMGLRICEDIWRGNEELHEIKRYHRAPVDAFMENRLDALVVVNASIMAVLSWPPEIKVNYPWGAARCMGTWWAASVCCRTYPKPRYMALAATSIKMVK